MSSGHNALLRTALCSHENPTNAFTVLPLLRPEKQGAGGQFIWGHVLAPRSFGTDFLMRWLPLFLVKAISSMYSISLKIKWTASGKTNGNTANILNPPSPWTARSLLMRCYSRRVSLEHAVELALTSCAPYASPGQKKSQLPVKQDHYTTGGTEAQSGVRVW